MKSELQMTFILFSKVSGIDSKPKENDVGRSVATCKLRLFVSPHMDAAARCSTRFQCLCIVWDRPCGLGWRLVLGGAFFAWLGTIWSQLLTPDEALRNRVVVDL